MLLLLKLLLLALSFLGYSLLLVRKARLRVEFVPAVLFASVILVMFFAGLLNCLPQTAWILYLTGFILLGLELFQLFRRHEYKRVFFRFLTPGFLFFVLACGFFVITVRHLHFSHYDEFSHWGLIVKELDLHDRLPNFTSNLIMFQSYPPGSALFIYYVTRFIGFTESAAYMAQLILWSSCACTLFAFVRGRRNWFAILIALFGCMALVLRGNAISMLYVDNLVAILPLANLAVIFYYRRNPALAGLATIPLAAATILVKNSGLFFAVINLIVLLVWTCIYVVRRRKRIHRWPGKRVLMAFVCAIAVPICSSLLWSQHVAMVFREGEVGKHAVNAESYEKILEEKTPEVISTIRERFINRVTDVRHNRATRDLLAIDATMLLLFLTATFLRKRRHAVYWAKIFGICNGVFIIYTIGIYLMYLLSMPTPEALTLGGFKRYIDTGVIYVTGIFLIACLNRIGKPQVTARYFYPTAMTLLTSLYLVISPGNLHQLYRMPAYEGTTVQIMDDTLTYIPAKPKKWYLIYYPGFATDYGYGQYMVQYKLQSKWYTKLKEAPNRREFLKLLREYDYFIVLSKDDEIASLLATAQPDGNILGGYSAKRLHRAMIENIPYEQLS